MPNSLHDFFQQLGPMYPEFLVIAVALIALVADLVVPRGQKHLLGWLGLIGLAAAAALTLSLAADHAGNTQTAFFNGTFLFDPFSVFFKMVFYLSCSLGILLSMKYLSVEDIHRGEYYSLMLFATSGMMLMASAGDLITLYLGLELMALSIYILAGFMRGDGRSNEAGIKYLLLGAFSSGIMLYGMSLLYGLSGTTNLNGIMTFLQSADLTNPVIFLAMVMLIVSFGFKVAAVPFHMWVPDVYEGAPTSVTAFMSAGPKVAGFAVLLRVFVHALAPLQGHVSAILAVIAVLTMAVGNIMAISQTNIKRMLAYSSIAHAGYALVGLAAATANKAMMVDGSASVMLYVLIYTVMNMGAFGVVIMLRKSGSRGEEIADFAGLGKTNKAAAFLMLIFMFSLTGIPPLAGFMGKFYIFKSAVQAGMIWLAILGVLFSAISAYFYLRVIMVMWMYDPKQEFSLLRSPALALALAIAVTAVIVIGVAPSSVLEIARASVLGLM
ncbi:MAG: NADH-quinone oxidoreductase subunit N [Nitrospiraceae bacterium]|nr:NADH-quinone oxidoreductase subunit N [Nitrospiraceae bacterium]